MADHPDWEQRLKEDYELKITRKGYYAIFNYGFEADFSDPIVQESRGIIIDTEKLEVACWPFRKFGNFNESYADPIDWKTARVQEKVDGSIIKLWYDKRDGRWTFSTNSVIDAADAKPGDRMNLSFTDIIQNAVNYKKIDMSRLDCDKTYIFELVSPMTQIVVHYDMAKLFHIGTRHNVTGQESNDDIGITKPAEYPLGSLDECIDAVKKLNAGEVEEVKHEGFVVVDASWHRVKIKSPDYLVKHAISSICLTPTNCMKLLWEENKDPRWLCEIRPNDAAVIKYYDWQIEEVRMQADYMAELARAMYEEYEHDRGAVARMISKDPLSFVGFAALNSKQSGRELLRKVSLAKLLRLIRPYPGRE